MQFACVDIGNTRAHLGAFEGLKLLEAFSIPLSRIKYPNTYKRLLKYDVKAIAYASVAPEIEGRFEVACKHNLRLFTVKLGRDIKVPIKIKTKNPDEVGVDRLCNAIAAYQKIKRSLLVVDLGSAITFDVVSNKGEFLGGIIAPGLDVMSKGLYKYCQLLPKVKPTIPKRFIAKDTVSNIQAGIYLAVEGLLICGIEKLVKEMKTRPCIMATGGDSWIFKKLDIFDEIDPDLTLKGIAISFLYAKGAII
jgi:type III pantothenate kinase